MNQKLFFEKSYISESNTVNDMKLMILAKIRVIRTAHAQRVFRFPRGKYYWSQPPNNPSSEQIFPRIPFLSWFLKAMHAELASHNKSNAFCSISVPLYIGIQWLLVKPVMCSIGECDPHCTATFHSDQNCQHQSRCTFLHGRCCCRPQPKVKTMLLWSI